LGRGGFARRTAEGEAKGWGRQKEEGRRKKAEGRRKKAEGDGGASFLLFPLTFSLGGREATKKGNDDAYTSGNFVGFAAAGADGGDDWESGE
jgi:hypothetical protein